MGVNKTCPRCRNRIFAVIRRKVYHYCTYDNHTYVVTDSGFRLGSTE